MSTGDVLTPNEVSLLLRVAPTTVRDHRWRHRVGLPVCRVGGFLRFLRSDVEALLLRGREDRPDELRL